MLASPLTIQTLRQNLVRTDDAWPAVYIAGPMRGYEHFNYPKFNEVARRFRFEGFVVYNPAEHGEQEAKPGDHILKAYMEIDLPLVCRSDALIMLDGWDRSEGALLEFRVAQALDIPVYCEDGAKVIVMGVDASNDLILSLSYDHLMTPGANGGYRKPNEEVMDAYIAHQQERERAIFGITLEEELARENLNPVLRAAYEEAVEAGKAAGDGKCDDEDCACRKEWTPEQVMSADEWYRNRTDALIEDLHATSERHPASARFHEILTGLGELHDRKQQDYGRDQDPFANVRSSVDFGVDGWVGALIRLNDKIRRLQSMALKGHLVNESAVDSFRDIAVYAIIAMVLYEQQYGEEA